MSTRAAVRFFLALAAGVVVALGGVIFTGQRDVSPTMYPQEEAARVAQVIDGDTIILADGRTVRYIGIDTPETGKRYGRRECYADEATARNRELVAQRTVRLVRDVSDTDRYGRLLRYVYVGDDLINEVLVREGYARVVRYAPDTALHAVLLRAERAARGADRGLWGACE